MNRTLASLLCGLLAASITAQDPVPTKLDARDLRRAADAAVQVADWDTAIANYRKLTEVAPKEGRGWHMLGYCLHAKGLLDEALPIHEKATEFPEVAPTAAYNIACVHALKGDKEKAITWLGKAAKLGFGNVGHLDDDPDMDALRNDPRFLEIRKLMESAPVDAAARLQVYTGQTERKSSRLALFSQQGSPGQMAIDYGPVNWKDDYDSKVSSKEVAGRHWRFGRDYWTNLDSNLDAKIGGVGVPAGFYYLTLMQKEDGSFVLGIHDAAAVKAKKFDAFVAHLLQGGIEVPLVHTKVEGKAEKLDIAFEMKDLVAGELVVRFGPHQLTAPVSLKY